jgi:hypothetical protein
MEKNFKDEVKEKQRANELAVNLERYGETYSEPLRCVVM